MSIEPAAGARRLSLRTPEPDPHLPVVPSEADECGEKSLAVGNGRAGNCCALPSDLERDVLPALLDTVFECVRVTNPDGRLLHINAAGLAMLELDSAADLVGRSLKSFLLPEYHELYEQTLRDVETKGTQCIEYRFRSARGTYRWAESRQSPVFGEDGKLRYIVAVSRDITEQRRGDALQQAENRVLELLAGGATSAAVFPKLIAMIEELTDGMLASILLLSPDGKRLCYAAAPSLPDEYNTLIDGVEIGPNVGSCGTAAYTGQRVIVCNTQTDPRWADYREVAAQFGLQACWSQPILAADGSVLGTFAMYYHEPRGPSDFELQVIESAAFLAGIALQQERAAEATRRHQEQLAHSSRLNLMGELVAGIAHEINQPLYAVANFSDACRKLLEQDHFDRRQLAEWLGKIHSQVQRANVIIEKLRSFIRKQPIERNRVAVRQLIEDAVALLEPELKRTGTTLRQHLTSQPVEVNVDAVHIQQTLMNLVQNAVQAMSETPPQDRCIDIRTTVVNDVVEVTVCDRGTGIDPAIRDTIFQPFVTTRSEGLGLGLSLSRSIVEHHGGRMWATNNVPSGCCIHFTLPIAQPPQTHESAAAECD